MGTPPTQGKATGDSFSIDWNSKTRIAGHLREEAGPCTDHIFLVPKVRRPPWPYMRRKVSLGAKWESCQRMLYPDAFSVGSILAKRCVCTHGRILPFPQSGLGAGCLSQITDSHTGRVRWSEVGTLFRTSTSALHFLLFCPRLMQFSVDLAPLPTPDQEILFFF